MNTDLIVVGRGADADAEGRDSTARVDVVPYEDAVLSPFQKAMQEWLSARQLTDLTGILTNPRGCGLEGSIDFDRKVLEAPIRAQFHLFWQSLYPEMISAFGKHQMLLQYFFMDSSYTILQAALINKIQVGKIPHPDGKKTESGRKGKPGSVEDDCARAKGSLARDLADLLSEHLKRCSSGNVENDSAFFHGMFAYIGFDPYMEEYLQARILHHHGLPNVYQATQYGILLRTSLGQVFGVDSKRTTADQVIECQPRMHSWPEAYKRPPLLDKVLDPSLEYYDPARVRESFQDMCPNDPVEVGKRVKEAVDIILALENFRKRLLENSEIKEV